MPSLTLTVTKVVPTSPGPGVPERMTPAGPGVSVTHDGMLAEGVYVNGSLSGSLAKMEIVDIVPEEAIHVPGLETKGAALSATTFTKNVFVMVCV